VAEEKAITPDEFYRKVSKEDKEAIVDLNSDKPIEFIPTGSWVLNTLIGDGTMTGKSGGFPRGHIVEIFGDESSGKTTMALSACRQVQEMGGLPVYIDFEQTFHKKYAENIGINTDKDKFVLMQPRHFEHGARLIKDSFKMKPALIAVDSVSAMLPKQFLEGAIDEAGRIGLQAQLMSGFLSYITKSLKDSNACLLFTNQLRSVIKKSKYEPGPMEESSGGRALKFYSSVRIKLRKSTIEEISAMSNITGKSEKKPVNVMIKTVVIKNKIDRPYMSGPVYIRFGEGFDNILSIIELAINTKVIKKSGAFFTFEKDKKAIFKIQGKEKLRNRLSEDSDLFKQIQGSLTFKEDQQAKIDYKNQEDPDVETENEMDSMMTNIAEQYKKNQKEKKEKKIK